MAITDVHKWKFRYKPGRERLSYQQLIDQKMVQKQITCFEGAMPQ